MGRGRAKAKQTRVARQLKYAAPATDLDALQRELRGSNGDEKTEPASDLTDHDDEYDDEYAAYLPDDSDDEER